MTQVVALGECMVELRLADSRTAAIDYAGDTFNTAVYLSRLGLAAAYATALGRGDPFSLGILGRMGEEGVSPELVIEAPGRLPGLYAIQRDARGERSFHYWRKEAPVRDYFRLADLGRLERALREAQLVYLSGVTLAVIGEDGRAALGSLLARAASAGAAVAFDANYRPQLWESPEAARAACEAVVPHCRYVSVGSEDAAGLYKRPLQAVARVWTGQGAEVVARSHDGGVIVHRGDERLSLPPEPPVEALDTTGAGDSFNAAYLAARLSGERPNAAIARARGLARVVVQHLGAIIPREAMPRATET